MGKVTISECRKVVRDSENIKKKPGAFCGFNVFFNRSQRDLTKQKMTLCTHQTQFLDQLPIFTNYAP